MRAPKETRGQANLPLARSACAGLDKHAVALRSDKPVPSFPMLLFFIAAGVAQRLIATVPDFFTSAASAVNFASGSWNGLKAFIAG